MPHSLDSLQSRRLRRGFAQSTATRVSHHRASGVSLGDSLAGLFGAPGALIALVAQFRTGEGQVTDVSLTESCIALLEEAIPEYDRLGLVRRPSGTWLVTIAPSNIFSSKDDRWVVIAANQDGPFRKLCDVMERPELPTDIRLAHHDARDEHQDEIEEEVAAWARSRDAAQIVSELRNVGEPCGPVSTVADVVGDDHFRESEAFVVHHDDELGDFLGPAIMPKLSRTPVSVPWTGSTRSGTHDNEVFGELLGMSVAKQSKLDEDGVI